MTREFALNVARPYHPILLSPAEFERGEVDEVEEVLRGIFPSGDQATEAAAGEKASLLSRACGSGGAYARPGFFDRRLRFGAIRSMVGTDHYESCYLHRFAQRPKAFCCFRIGSRRQHSAQLFMVGGPCAPFTWHLSGISRLVCLRGDSRQRNFDRAPHKVKPLF